MKNYTIHLGRRKKRGLISEKQCKIIGKLKNATLLNYNISGKHKWKCTRDHVFNSTYQTIKNKYVCFKCLNDDYNVDITPSMVNMILTLALDRSFANKCPKFLINKEKRQLKISGYNEELRLGYIYTHPNYNNHIKGYNTKKEIINNFKIFDHKVKLFKENKNNLIHITYEIKKNLLVKHVYKFLEEYKLTNYKDVLNKFVEKFN